MTIQFRRLEDPPPEDPDEERAFAAPWLPPVSQAQAEAALFHFLKGLLADRFETQQPLLLSPDTLHALYQDPHSPLLAAFGRHQDDFLVELHPDVSRWSPRPVPPDLLGVALVAHNCFLPHLADPVVAFTRALLQTIPPARTPAAALAYHSLLRRPVQALVDWPADAVRTQLLHALINRSPLTALDALALHTPPALTRLAADLLRWWRRRVVDPAPWRNLEDWLDVVAALLAEPLLARYLRQRWLALPSQRVAGRNLGLLLAALYAKGTHTDILLTFYNAYAYSAYTLVDDGWDRQRRHWPELARIERLLRVNEAQNPAAGVLNRRGSEWFLKFWPLVQWVADNGSQLPAQPGYRYIGQNLVRALLPLVDFAAISEAGAGLQTGSIRFVSEDEV